MRTLFRLLEPRHRRQLLLTVVVMIAISVLEIVGIGSIFPLIAVLIDPTRINSLPIIADVYTLLQPIGPGRFGMLMAAVVAGLLAVKVVVTGFSYRWQFRFAYDIQRTLATRLLTTYLFAPYRFYLNKNTADLLKNIQSEIPALANGALIPSLQVASETIVMLAVLGLLLIVNPPLTAAAILIVGVVMPGVLWLTKRKTEEYATQRRVTVAQMYRTASAALGGFKDLKVLGRQPHFIKEYEGASRKYCESNAYIMLMGQVPRLVLELVMFIGVIAVLLYATYWTGDARNALPLLGLYAVATARLMPSMNKIIIGIMQIRYYRGVLGLLPTFFTEPNLASVGQAAGGAGAVIFERQVRISDLSYRYPGAERNALEGISLVIPKGATVAMVGPSGAGKTTLVDVILGLLDEYGGKVEIDDAVLSKENIEAWQRHVGYVPQTVFLADDSIARNVAFGVPPERIDAQAVARAIAAAQLTETVAGLPHGLETIIGERGIRLSGGQRQRIGIARALYGNPDVLVLDEATSALDGLTEQEIAQEIQLLAGQKTIIVIAHRLSTIRQCETIFLLEKGRITASGNYEELVRKSGYFAQVAAHR